MNGRVVSGRPARDFEVEEAVALDRLAAGQLAEVRRVAANWRNGVGLTGVATLVVTVVTGTDVVSGASAQSLHDGVWLLGIGFVLAAVSLSLAMRASFGWPRRIDVSQTGALKLWEAGEVESAICFFKWSLILAVPALATFALAFGVLVYGVPLAVHFPGW